MPVKKLIPEKDGVYFFTFTCAGWLSLFHIADGYRYVYKWFDVLVKNGHYIIGYVIMLNHVHAIIAFRNTGKTINSIIANGKRFLAYDLVAALEFKNEVVVLNQLNGWVNATDKSRDKQHEVFESSFDWKECRTEKFIQQKLNYIHWNPCKSKLVKLPEQYIHSSAKFYITDEQGVYSITSFMELRDIDLTRPL
ncbi:MAG TPA: hypothetical protein VFW07_01820 [Parafilimonas sp.]|nr:hypothetical protein [Parafilimonas sp.]